MPSMLEAINDKYGMFGDETFDYTPIAIHVPRKSPRKYVPSLLILNDCDIDTCGSDHEDLKEKCSSVEDLDLAQNSLSKWNEVFSIFRVMPRLKFVNLSFNDLSEDIYFGETKKFGSIRSLVLNATHISWKSIRHMLKLLPNIEELHLCLNCYDDVYLTDEDGSPITLPSMKKLHFNSNPITNWPVVAKLGIAFPSLESLVMVDCPIKSMSMSPSLMYYTRSDSDPESSETKSNAPHDAFRYLRFLNLSNTLLSSWADIDDLSRFPALTCLRVLGCPLFEAYTKHERRQFLISRLPNITVLNGGGVIEYEEREDSERAFIRYYADKTESDRPHRYDELVSTHGKLHPLVDIDLSPERRVKVLIVFGNQMEERVLDVYQSVADLKQKLSKFTKMPACRMKLFYVDQHMKIVTGPEHMKFPNKQLYSYNIRNGDEIIVDCKKNKNRD